MFSLLEGYVAVSTRLIAIQVNHIVFFRVHQRGHLVNFEGLASSCGVRSWFVFLVAVRHTKLSYTRIFRASIQVL